MEEICVHSQGYISAVVDTALTVALGGADLPYLSSAEKAALSALNTVSISLGLEEVTSRIESIVARALEAGMLPSGTEIVVKRGPFYGFKGTISDRKARAKDCQMVKLNVFGAVSEIALSLDDLAPVEPIAEVAKL